MGKHGRESAGGPAPRGRLRMDGADDEKLDCVLRRLESRLAAQESRLTALVDLACAGLREEIGVEEALVKLAALRARLDAAGKLIERAGDLVEKANGDDGYPIEVGEVLLADLRAWGKQS